MSMIDRRHLRLWLTRQGALWVFAGIVWAFYLGGFGDNPRRMAVIIAAAWASPVLLPVMAWRDWGWVGRNLHRLNTLGVPRSGQ